MRWLFIFAHPDDESVACAGTITALVTNGESVSVVSVTQGDAGEVSDVAQNDLKKLGSVSAVRKAEFSKACRAMGVSDARVLNYADGTITNSMVWGALKQEIIELIDSVKPDFVVTFDHAGWYFHLDHVAVSIATTLAYHAAKHQPLGLVLSHFRPNSTKWKYRIPEMTPTHKFLVGDTQHKLRVLENHRSQDLTTPQKHIQSEQTHYEWYELIFQQETAAEALRGLGFEEV